MWLLKKERSRCAVLAGDLMNGSRTFRQRKLFLQVGLNRLAPFGIPVVVALGNHDAGTSYVSGEAYLYF